MERIPNLDLSLLRSAYTAPEVWDRFYPGALTLCSPDPQAVRPPDEKANAPQVTLPTNFKVARFDDEKSNAILKQLEDDITLLVMREWSFRSNYGSMTRCSCRSRSGRC